jgi:hypothetical protein
VDRVHGPEGPPVSGAGNLLWRCLRGLIRG